MKTKLLHTIGAMAMTWPVMGATLTSGHVDFIGIGYVGGALEPHSHAHAGAVVDGVTLLEDTEYELGELELQVVGSVTRPAGSEWSAVGVGSGVSFWALPETSSPGQPFAGIGAEELTPSDWISPIRLTLTNMSAPVGAHFSLLQTDAFGDPTFFMSTLDGGITAGDFYSMDLSIEDHAHFLWGFTELGVYDLTFEISGEHAVDGLKSTSATYRFNVIPEPSTGLMGLLGIGLLWRRKRQ
jgi:surface-anchored protein